MHDRPLIQANNLQENQAAFNSNPSQGCMYLAVARYGAQKELLLNLRLMYDRPSNLKQHFIQYFI